MKIRALQWAALAVLGLAASAPAQEGAPAEDFFAVIDVEVINIDVWVTDADGRPVEGLRQEDFVVTRDGAPVDVTNFFAVAGGRPVDPVPRPEPSSEPAPAPSPLEAVAPAPEEHQLWVIVYVDNFNIDPIERNRVLPAVRDFVSRAVRSGGRAMIVTYDRGLEVEQPFSDSLPDVLDALAGLQDDAGQATIRRREQMDTLRRIDEASSSSQALLAARQHAEAQLNEIGFTVDAMRRLIDTLGGLPGRKALLHVSSGVSMLAGEEMFHAVAEKFGTTAPYAEIPRHDASRDFEALGRLANSHRVVLYMLDAGGNRGMEFGNAEYSGFVDMDLRSTLDSVVPENLQAPLRFLALETGGQAIVNRNEILPALDEVSRDFGSFYSLGIAAESVDSGRYHELAVRLAEPRRGVRVRHRAGYTSKSSDARMRESLRSALLYEHQHNPLGVEVTWGRPEPGGEGGNFVLPLQLRLPMRDVVLLPVGEGVHEARLELYVGAVGEGGQSPVIEKAPLGVRLADEHVEAARGEALLHTHRILVGPGRKKVGLAVLDLFGREWAVVTRYLDIGVAAEATRP